MQLRLLHILTHLLRPFNILLNRCDFVLVLDEEVKALPYCILRLLNANLISKQTLQEFILQLAQLLRCSLLLLKLLQFLYNLADLELAPRLLKHGRRPFDPANIQIVIIIKFPKTNGLRMVEFLKESQHVQ